jgi:hypothetical protein
MEGNISDNQKAKRAQETREMLKMTNICSSTRIDELCVCHIRVTLIISTIITHTNINSREDTP